MSVWVVALISGLLCTQIANPFFWFRLGRGIKSYRNDVRDFRSAPDSRHKPEIRDYLEENQLGSFKHVICGNIICFVISFTIFWLAHYFDVHARTFSTIVFAMWASAIGNAISTCISFWKARQFEGVEYLQALAFSIAMIIIWLALLIHGSIYNHTHQVDANTLLAESEVPVISVDVSTMLEKMAIIEGYTLQKPISRNGKVVFPMSREDESNISIAGYVELSSDGTPNIVKKELHYTPYQKGSQNIKYVARDYLPTKQFFGEWSFQLSPDGDVYFANMYGNFACLLGGREVTGILLVNATTGECQAIAINEVPNWISGISE